MPVKLTLSTLNARSTHVKCVCPSVDRSVGPMVSIPIQKAIRPKIIDIAARGHYNLVMRFGKKYWECGLHLALLVLVGFSAACSDDDTGIATNEHADASTVDVARDVPLDTSTDEKQESAEIDAPADLTLGDSSEADGIVDATLDSAPEAAPDAESESPFVVFVHPAGDDADDGSTPNHAVLTLGRVQEILRAAAPERNVEVRIAQGTYTGQSVTWDYYHPDYEIAFMPIDYHGGGIGSIAGRPVFDGKGARVLLTLDVADGRETNLAFIYLRIEHYRVMGLNFRGNRNDFEHGWNGGNRVFGCLLSDVGNLANAGKHGFGGLDLVNSRHNEIQNNHFLQQENASSSAALMHAIYLAHGSSYNEIRSNRFVDVSGDPVRVRDGSNHNQVEDNVFEKTGSAAFISDWWCDKDEKTNCTKPSGECPSWENAFRDNELHCGYRGNSIATFKYFQGVNYVPHWCVNHANTDGWARLRTSGNTKSCP